MCCSEGGDALFKHLTLLNCNVYGRIFMCLRVLSVGGRL